MLLALFFYSEMISSVLEPEFDWICSDGAVHCKLLRFLKYSLHQSSLSV